MPRSRPARRPPSARPAAEAPSALLLAALVVSLAVIPGTSAAGGALPVDCLVVDVDRVGAERLAEARRWPGLELWAEADDELLACGPAAVLGGLAGRFTVRREHRGVVPDRLALLQRAHRDDLGLPGIRTLVAGGRMAVVEVTPGADLAAPWHPHHAAVPGRPGPASVGAALGRFRSGAVLAHQVANDPMPARLPAARRPAAARLADAVDPDRWFADVVTLAGYNRHTFSTGPGAIHDARDWLVARFDELPGVDAAPWAFTIGATPAYNVVATLPGTSRPDDWVLVGAHYDARTASIFDSSTPAPGAEDNGSGCAGVLEMARLLAAHPPETTVVFLCFSGEEEGLYGSEAHATSLVASGDAAKVRAMLNMDMIGFTEDSDLDCLLEAEPVGQDLVDTLVAAAAAHTGLRIVTDVCNGCAWGSDHVPYGDLGMPAALTIENDWNHYPHYHRATDLPPELSVAMGGEVLRMNAAALAVIAGAAVEPPLFADGFESGDLTAWSAASP